MTTMRRLLLLISVSIGLLSLFLIVVTSSPPSWFSSWGELKLHDHAYQQRFSTRHAAIQNRKQSNLENNPHQSTIDKDQNQEHRRHLHHYHHHQQQRQLLEASPPRRTGSSIQVVKGGESQQNKMRKQEPERQRRQLSTRRKIKDHYYGQPSPNPTSESTTSRDIQDRQNNNPVPPKQQPGLQTPTTDGEIDVTSPPLTNLPTSPPSLKPTAKGTMGDGNNNNPSSTIGPSTSISMPVSQSQPPTTMPVPTSQPSTNMAVPESSQPPSALPMQQSPPPVQSPNNELVIPPTNGTNVDGNLLGRLPLILESIASQIHNNTGAGGGGGASGSDSGGSRFIDIDAILSDESSYQYMAMERTMEQTYADSMSDRQLLQHWILYCIYYGTTGSGWIQNSGWEDRNQDPCISPGWFGVSCGTMSSSSSSSSSGPPTTQKVITEIRLSRNNLRGPIPPVISLLAFDGPRSIAGVGDLYHLDVSYNPYLTNVLDDVSSSSRRQSWISYLGSHLQVLNYGTTALGNNGIPTTRLPENLVEYDCSYIDYSGPLPHETFENLNSLEWLMLDGNSYAATVKAESSTGSETTIPTSITQLPNLKYLYLRNASLSCDLSYLQNMTPSLVEHVVDDNPNLIGTIPTSISTLSSLKSFSATDCGLTGTLPEELLAMTSLVQLWLFGNQQLVGTIPIPDEFNTSNNFKNMRILALEDTSIRGIMPFAICLEKEFDTNGSFLSTLSADCNNVDCDAFFPDCCSCCGRLSCGT